MNLTAAFVATFAAGVAWGHGSWWVVPLGLYALINIVVWRAER